MDPTFWKTAWSEGRINFHEGAPNAFLRQFAAKLGGTSVLVPLCGKTDDLAFLASRGHQVIGIELVEDAVRAFFDEHQLEPLIEVGATLTRFIAGSITIIAGDFFTVTREDVGAIDAVYDRAALIALPAELRPRYLAHLRSLVPPATSGLLITLDYPQDQLTGPPFSVSDVEVNASYARADQLAEHPATGGRVGKLTDAFERCYAVTL
ncbi:thiopurine S-methyltransferase [soil metagenome]